MDQTDIVTDETGEFNSTGTRVTEANNILSLDTSSSFYSDIYLRAESFLQSVYTVHKM